MRPACALRIKVEVPLRYYSVGDGLWAKVRSRFATIVTRRPATLLIIIYDGVLRYL